MQDAFGRVLSCDGRVDEIGDETIRSLYLQYGAVRFSGSRFGPWAGPGNDFYLMIPAVVYLSF